MLSDEGQLIAATTPAGRAGWFFREWTEGEGWHRIKVAADQSSRVGEARLRARRTQMTPADYATEYMLSFGGSENGLYPPELVEAAMDRRVRLLAADWPRYGGAGR